MSYVQKMVSLLLTMIIGISLFQTNAYASTNEKTVTITFENGLNENDLPAGLLDSIIESNPDAGNIIIYEVGVALQPDILINKGANYSTLAQYFESVQSTQTWLINPENQRADIFQFSVARGQEVTLTTSYTVTVSISYSGQLIEVGTLSATITGGYTKSVSTKYYGPSDSSPYNSRQFRTKFFERILGVQQEVKLYINTLNGPVYSHNETRSGYCYIPTYYANYSIDSYVTP